MFIPRGVKRNHANAVYSPEAVKRAKAISSRIWPESTLNPPHTENDMTKTVAIQMQQAQEPQQTSVQHQEELTNEPSRDPEIALSYERSVDGDADDEEPVKETCFEQRFPLDGDPICIICGRYGEYINDTTNNDICSLECKAKDIQNVARNAHHSDICPGIAIPQYTIATNVHAKLTAYHDAPELSALYPKQVEAIRSAHDISIQGQHVPKPVLKFENCQLDDKLLSNLLKFGFSRPTPIQMQAIPAALAGRDIFALAPTSSGKTVSFLVPMITHCLSLAKMYGDIYRSGPLGLILAPTRELATQIEEVAKKLAKELPHMRTALLIGGMPIPNQLYRLKKGVQIVIGTPGRVIELLNHHKDSLKLDTIKMVVLDEVDMMFKLGFNEQVARILNSLVDPGVRQTCFYSATLEAERNMKKYCNKHMRDPINIRIGKSPSFEAKKYVKQTFMWVETQSKAKQLMSILRDPKYFEPPVLIFVDSKLATELLAQSIRKKIGSTAVAMHGDLSQPERDAILQQIRQSECDIVVATGILARGIDLPNVRMVINYDMANTVDEYIHQIGRAMVNDSSNSRGKKQHTRRQGWAITFINNVGLMQL
jgi:ATP-dependent RNA helicase DDX59